MVGRYFLRIIVSVIPLPTITVITRRVLFDAGFSVVCVALAPLPVPVRILADRWGLPGHKRPLLSAVVRIRIGSGQGIQMIYGYVYRHVCMCFSSRRGKAEETGRRRTGRQCGLAPMAVGDPSSYMMWFALSVRHTGTLARLPRPPLLYNRNTASRYPT